MKHKANKNKKWEDFYSRKAKNEHFPARSVYKLKEIQHKYRLINKGDRVLDLGCFPGSWLIYASDLVGKSGKVTGIDIKSVLIKVPSNVDFLALDIFSLSDKNPLKGADNSFNVVLSDMAPATSGNKRVDSARSMALCQAALSIAEKNLAQGGRFVCKIFQGEDFKDFENSVKQLFHKHKIFKPQSSRKSSREIYIIGLGKK